MQTAKQLSVTLVNKPGRLAAMLSALAKEKVTLRALVVMDSGDRGKVRFVPSDFAVATEVLDKMNVRYEAADVLLVDVTSQSGAFRNMCERLATEHLNIDYAYCSFGGNNGSKGGGVAVIKVNDLGKAQKILTETPVASDRRPGRRPIHAR